MKSGITNMSKKDIFVILPYLKTSQSVHLRGIPFHSNSDLEGLSPQQQDHFKTLFAMFFLRNDLHITHMIYAHLELGENQENNDHLIQRLYEAQILINYLYSTPHPSMGDPFLHSEHASMYVFTMDRVYPGLIWPSNSEDDGVENLSQEQLPTDRVVDGYNGLLNEVSHFWVVAGNRIYPPVPHLTLNLSQDLFHDLQRFVYHAKNWALSGLLWGRENDNSELRERLFTALEWHNRSTSENVSEEVALLDLAVAFESLLNLEQTEKLTDRFRETVMTLLGSVPRLDSWLEQFYHARSSIAHKGRSQHLMFYAIDRNKNQLSQIYKGKASDQPPLQYRSLTVYGRRIFRLCLNAILSGATMAEEDGLSALFVSNQERLEKICKQLEQTNETPQNRLHSIAKDVGDLHEHWLASENLVRSETLVAAGRLVVESYLATKPKLSKEGETKVQDVLQRLKQKDVSADEKLHLFEGLATALGQEQEPSTINPTPFEAGPPFTILSSLLNYVTSSGFLLEHGISRRRAKKVDFPGLIRCHNKEQCHSFW
jgi:hypothetical protein